MADSIVRLKVEDSSFNAQIKEAARTFADFGKRVASAGVDAMGDFAKGVKTAKVAFEGFNAALKANAIVLVASLAVEAASAIGNMIGDWITGADDAENAQARLNNQLEETKRIIEDINNEGNFNARMAKAAGASTTEILKMIAAQKKEALNVAANAVNDLPKNATLEQIQNAQKTLDKATKEYQKAVQDIKVDEVAKAHRTGEYAVRTSSGKGGSGGGVQSVVTAAQQTEYQQNQTRINDLTQEYVRISDDATEDVKERQQQIREEITLLERRNNLLKLYEDQAHGKLLGGTVETPTQGNVTGGLSVPKDGLGKGFKLQVQEAVDGGKQVEKSWRSAAQAASQFGSALQGIDDPAAKIAGTIAAAVANIALAFSSADLKDGETGNVWYWIAATAAGVATMISTISTIRSATSGYAEGGMVKGNSYSGDQVYARLNAGELVLTKAMQGNLASQLSDQNRGIHIVGVVQGENIVLAARTYGQRWGKNFLIKQG